ncbi:hypothetical protein FRC12_000058 [Ceratobasidium sp. 428]|nr:hypothetical protein FRC12_000058 [Ceratobasidium sp. 428]
MMSQKDELLWECLDDLQHRNYIVAPECDRILARTFSKAFFGRLTSANFSVCADHQDAENLLDMFRRNLRLIDPECSMPSLLWVTNSATIQKDRTRYAPQLINITRDLLALMIQVHHYGPDGMPSTVQLGTTLARRIGSYFCEAAFKGQASRALIERIIAESEVIGLGGQVYLQGMEHKLVSLTGRWLQSTQVSNKFRSEMSNALHSISGAVSEMDSIMRILPTVVTSMTPQLVLAHIDWSRIQLQTEVLSALYNVQSDVYRTHHIPWAHFGSALGFDLLSSRKCAYPRCFNDRPIPYSLLMACGSCQGTYYCSTTCQRCDWLLDSPLSHRQRCAEVKVEY